MSQLLPFAFDDSLVRVRAGDDGEPWFVARDVCNVLGLAEPASQHLKNLDDDAKGMGFTHTLGGEQQVVTVSESGLYALIFRSRKPEARRFRKWVTSEVLPSLRKTGSYAPGPKTATLEQLHRLVAVWAMLAESPRVALMDQVLSRFGIEAGEPEPGAVLAAVRFVLDQNDALLRKGRRVSREAARRYEAFARCEEPEPELVTAFWKQLDLLNAGPGPEGEARGWLNHSRSPAFLAVNLPQFLLASQAQGLYAFYAPELRRLLRSSAPRKLAAANKAMRSVHTGKALKCWVFYTTAGSVPMDGVGLESARGERPET